MPKAPSRCPICGGRLVITALECEECGTRFEGRFTTAHAASAFDRLTPEQLQFLEIFIRNEGKFSRMEKEMGLSYPTLRNRLRAIIRAMGYNYNADEEMEQPSHISPAERAQILDDLEQGKITAEEAAALLQGKQL